jgi:Fe-S-cluster-containing hydrogenase component 2
MKRKIIKINEELCTGCGECIPNCAEGSLQIVDGKAKLVADNLCDGLGACLGHCPTGALSIIEREADAFDEEAVEKFLAQEQKKQGAACPSAQLQTISCATANAPSTTQSSSGMTALSHWPVQICLVPPTAPFLENCHLLIAADCTAIACPNIQQDFIQGRNVLMGCPKFDDQQLYVDRFTELLSTRKVQSISILIMEVPCCAAMLQIVKKAYSQAGANLPVQQIVISTQGTVLRTEDWS